MEKFKINNQPSADELWAGIGGNFDSISQIICEFIDNSISNFLGNNCSQRNIRITIKNLANKKVKIIIEDSGTGIKNIDYAFTLGSRKSAESPYNEHGFGMKHALASANPKNDAWCIYTRTKEDLAAGICRRVSCPYKIADFSGEVISQKDWPKDSAYQGQSGTYIEFDSSWDMFSGLSRGIKGGVTSFDKLCDLLYEDLGFIYANLILKSQVNIDLVTIDMDSEAEHHIITAVIPEWNKELEPGEGISKVDLGGGEVTIHYHFGTIEDCGKQDDGHGNELQRTLFKNDITRKYYRKNMASSGVELRFNGRIMCTNLFKEIWGIEKHNAYNDLLITIDLESNNISCLPETRTSKNGLREGDEKLDNLFRWIRTYMAEPPKNLQETDHETDIFEQLKNVKEQQYEDFNPKKIEVEFPVFDDTGNSGDRERIDLYVNVNNKITIYEGKKEKTTAKDVYQLRMYWDGLVYKGIKPDKGILIAKEHSSGVKSLIKVLNEMTDQNGNKYNLILKTWQDESIPL